MILSGMQELAENRRERMRPDLRVEFPLITEIPAMVWPGSLSWAIPSERRRLIKKSAVVDLFGFPQTPTEIGRDYLRVKYTEKRRHFTGQYAAINEPRSAPLYAKPGNYRNMVYADLKSAYWSIMELWGWDVDYWPGKFVSKRSSVADFPLPNHKLARNSLVTAGLLTPSIIWTGTKFVRVKGGNPLVNYDIWALCQDTLAAMAHLAYKAGAVYIHTDGYIIPDFMFSRLRGEVAEWNLKLTVRHRGDAIVKGIGAYKVGDAKSGHFHVPHHAFFAVRKPNIPHLRNAFRGIR